MLSKIRAFYKIKETLAFLGKNNALLEVHSEDYKRLIEAYNGADFSDFVSPLYKLESIKAYLHEENKNGNISANQLAMILAQNNMFKEALTILELGDEKNVHKIWRLICLMTIENKALFFECLTNELSYESAKVELLIKATSFHSSKENIKSAKKLLPQLPIYYQNIYKKEIALFYYKCNEIKKFKKTYKDIDSLLVRIEILNALSGLS